MHSQLSLLLLIFTAFATILLTPGSASVLPSSPPPLSAIGTTETTSTSSLSAIATAETTSASSNPPTNALLPRAPERQVGIPFARCSCRAGIMAFSWDCFIYQILNWPAEQNVILRLHDELIKCGTHLWGLSRYYIPERDSGLGAFAYFELQFAHMRGCWRRGIARALGTTGVVCSVSHTQPKPNTVLPWWE